MGVGARGFTGSAGAGTGGGAGAATGGAGSPTNRTRARTRAESGVCPRCAGTNVHVRAAANAAASSAGDTEASTRASATCPSASTTSSSGTSTSCVSALPSGHAAFGVPRSCGISGGGWANALPVRPERASAMESAARRAVRDGGGRRGIEDQAHREQRSA
jgi:hypothetical protein